MTKFVMACMLFGGAADAEDQAKINQAVAMCSETYETATECWAAVDRIKAMKTYGLWQIHAGCREEGQD